MIYRFDSQEWFLYGSLQLFKQHEFTLILIYEYYFGLYFQVFGLGNKTYEHYNAMGRFVDKRLEEMGANRVFEKGEGDDDGK